MPENGSRGGPAGRGRKVCVVGAGISGLVAVKVLLGRGHDVAVVEKGGDLGGVWEPARSYPGVRTQTPRDLYRFSDFPMPADYPEWPTGAQMHAYLDAYAARFGLRPRMRFRTEVLFMLRRPYGGRGWSVTLRTPGSAPETERYDFVVVTTGQFNRPRPGGAGRPGPVGRSRGVGRRGRRGCPAAARSLRTRTVRALRALRALGRAAACPLGRAGKTR